MTSPPFYPPSITPPQKPLSIPALVVRVIRNSISAIPQGAYEDPITVVRSRTRNVVWISDPDLVETLLIERAGDLEKAPVERRIFSRTLQDGVFSSEGALWRWQRRTIAPVMRHTEITRYLPSFEECAQQQLRLWQHSSSPTVHIDAAMEDTTFSIIVKSMLGCDPTADTELIKKRTADIVANISWEIAYGVARLPRWLPYPGRKTLVEASADIRRVTSRLIAQRQADNAAAPRADLLQYLIDARNPDTGEPMEHERLVSNLLTLFEAGYETTGRGLTWALYILARLPDLQDQVRNEITAVVGEERLTARHLEALTFTKQVISEVLRLYPPVPILTRVITTDMDLAGHALPKGASLIFPIYSIHRHRRLWTDPDRFDPSRFAPGEPPPKRGQYLPFGLGPRICLGVAFAQTELLTVLATFLRSMRFEWPGGPEPTPISRVTLQPKGGLFLRVSPIKAES